MSYNDRISQGLDVIKLLSKVLFVVNIFMILAIFIFSIRNYGKADFIYQLSGSIFVIVAINAVSMIIKLTFSHIINKN